MFENKPPGHNFLNKKPKYLTSTHFIKIITIVMIFTLGQQIKQKNHKTTCFHLQDILQHSLLSKKDLSAKHKKILYIYVYIQY